MAGEEGAHRRDERAARGELGVHWRFAFWLWWPTLVAAVVLKFGRVLPLVAGRTLAALEAVRPEVALYLGLLLLTGWTLGLSPRASVRSAWAAAWGLLAVLFLLTEVVGYFFFLTTGSYLDAPMAAFAILRFGEVWQVLRSEVTWIAATFMAVPVAWFALVYRTRPWGPRHAAEVAGESDLRPLLAGLALVVAAVPAPVGLPSKAVGRAAVVEMAWTTVTVRRFPTVVPDEPGAWEQAELVQVDAAPRWRNVVVIWLESTGYDASLGGDPRIAPNLAALASDSLVATNAWTVVPHSTKATVPIFCGTPPAPTPWITEAERLPVRCLPHLLRERGYATLLMRSGTRHFEGWDDVVAHLGFEEFVALEDLDTEGFETVNYFGIEDDALLEPARRWLDARGEQPYLLVYMTGAPHHDYRVPTRFERIPLSPDEEHDRYLNAVRYVDRFVGKVIDMHRAAGSYDDTLFVIVGDHGEAFGEHQRRQHDAVPYEEVVHVPLVVHAPGAFAGGLRVEAPTSQLDVPPTIAALLGWRLDAPRREGVPLTGPVPERRLAMYCWYARRCGALRDGDFKLVYHFDERPSELFDLASDPDERHDLAAEHPERVAAMREALLLWLGEVEARWRPDGR